MSKLFQSKIFQTLIINSIILVSALANSILQSHLLHPKGRGEITAILLWPNVIGYLLEFGLTESVIYHIAQDTTRTVRVAGNALIIGIVQGVLGFLVGIVGIPILLGDQSTQTIALSVLFSITIPGAILADYFVNILRALLRINTYNLLRLVVPIGYTLSLLLLYIIRAVSVTNLVYLYLFVYFFFLLLVAVACLVEKVKIQIWIDFLLIRSMLHYGIQNYGSTIFININVRLDQLVMSVMLPPEQLGLYVVAVTTTNFATMLAQAFSAIILPQMARYADQSEKIEYFKRVFSIFWYVSLVLAFGLMLVLPLAIPIVFGDEFRAATFAAEILIVGALLYSTKTVIVTGLQALGMPAIGSRAELMGAIATVILLLVLLPLMGYVGAAVASTIAYFIVLIISVYAFYRFFRLRPADYFFNATLLSTGMTYVRRWAARMTTSR